MKLGIFVGTFNPVHKGHIYLVNELLKQNYFDKIFVVPTLSYWNKINIVPLKHRINMLKFYETDNIIIDTENNTKEYTYQIMDIYHDNYPNDIIKLIIGADNLEKFNKWKRYKHILDYGLVVIARDKINLEKNYKNIEIASINEYNISSTEVRLDKEKQKKYLDKKVLKYIKENNLYD